ncbi:MAG TPA: methyltransferase domain-containing protein, partial [Pirellulaceae bacterium]
MPRRALRQRTDPVSTQKHLWKPDRLPQPWDPMAVFGRTGDLVLEIGSGKGLFLQSASRARPADLFLGIERSQAYAEFAAARLARQGVENAVVLNADAREMVTAYFPTASAAEVHVYFPDPWWKQRHRRRRLM